MIWELKNITKENINAIAIYFQNNNSIKEIIENHTIIEDNKYGTLFLESKFDETIKFSVHKAENTKEYFNSITFFKVSITIKELKYLYPLYTKTYIPYDSEDCYTFKSLNKNYIINAFLDRKSNEDLCNIARLTIRWEINY